MEKIVFSTRTLVTAMMILLVFTTSMAYRSTPSVILSTQPGKFKPLLPDFDLRLAQGIGQMSLTRTQTAALSRLEKQVGRDLHASFDRSTGTPRHLFSLTRFLSPTSGDDRVEIALDFLRQNNDLFRLAHDEIDTLRIAKNYVTKHNGVTHLAFQQFYDGIEIFQSDLRVNLSADGQIISVNGRYYPGSGASLLPTRTASEAVVLAVEASFPEVVFVPIVMQPASGSNQLTAFHRGDFVDDVTAKLVLFPASDRTRLGWRVRLHLPDRAACYDLVIDAESGELLYRHNLYDFDQPQGMVFQTNPDLGPQVLRPFTGDPLASPATWVSPLPNVRTFGNNVIVVPAPANTQQNFQFPFLDTYAQSGMNKFDLDRKKIRFAPNAAGGYDPSSVPFSFDSSLGTDLTQSLANRDDGSMLFKLGFNFPFFGSTYTAVYLNANGHVTFTNPSSLFTASAENLAFGQPRIAALWDDLDLRSSGELFAKTVGTPATRAVITWNNVPRRGATTTPNSNTIQLTLFNDGAVEIAYNGVSLTDGVVGLTRGMGERDLRQVDLSASAPVTGFGQGLYEKFPAVEIEAAATNLFYHLNFMHDYLYQLGFDEAAGNFQMDNFGRGGRGNDAVIGYPQAAGTNNANFSTSEDGVPPRTRFFFFTNPPFRQVDADFDADVIYHEYTHGLSRRLVGGPHNVGVFSGLQDGALSEGWSDAYSVSITDDPVTGEYSTGNRTTGIRMVAYNRSPLRYGDFGNRMSTPGAGMGAIFSAETHRDGEIWASVLWDLRTALGQSQYEQLITDGLKFTPPNPSMLEARDAILLADRVNNSGANIPAIWNVFAARGMGFSAQSGDGFDTMVFQAFDTPSDPPPPVKSVLFSDDMESGVNGWTVTPASGLWHQSNRRSASGSTAWYYGQEATGNYSTGSSANFGALTSPRITLPMISGNAALVLAFDHFRRVGFGLSTASDGGFVRIIDTASGAASQRAFVINNTPTSSVPFVEAFFEHRELNISEFAGKTIQIQFYFDTLDGFSNSSEGWYIDNVGVSLRAK